MSENRHNEDREKSIACLKQVYTDLELSSQYKKYNFQSILRQLIEDGRTMSSVDVDSSLKYGTRREITFIVGGIYTVPFMLKAMEGYKHSLDDINPEKYDAFSKPTQLFNAMLADGETLKRFSHDMRDIPQIQTRYAIAPYGDKSMATAIVMTVKEQFSGGIDAYINLFLNTPRSVLRERAQDNRSRVFSM